MKRRMSPRVQATLLDAGTDSGRGRAGLGRRRRCQQRGRKATSATPQACMSETSTESQKSLPPSPLSPSSNCPAQLQFAPQHSVEAGGRVIQESHVGLIGADLRNKDRNIEQAHGEQANMSYLCTNYRLRVANPSGVIAVV